MSRKVKEEKLDVNHPQVLLGDLEKKLSSPVVGDLTQELNRIVYYVSWLGSYGDIDVMKEGVNGSSKFVFIYGGKRVDLSISRLQRYYPGFRDSLNYLCERTLKKEHKNTISIFSQG